MTGRLVLVVADHQDLGVRAAARAAALTLGRTAPDVGVVVVSGDDLAAARWSHRVRADGRTHTTVVLEGMPRRAFTDRDLAAVLFRSQEWRVPPGLRAGSEGDVEYAWAELNALFVSWLASQGSKALNALEGGSPSGPSWSTARWRQVAAEVGLPVADADVHRSILVAGTRVTGATSAEEERRCLELAARAGCRHLEISLTAGDQVCHAEPVPRLVDPAHVAATTAMLVEAAS